MTEGKEPIKGEQDEGQELKGEAKEGWDKTRQELDQYKANVEKIAGQRDALEEQVSELQAVIEQERQETAQKLAGIERQITEKAKVEQVDDIDNLDPDYIDEKVIKALKGLKTQQQKLETLLAEKDNDIAKLKEAKEQYEADRLKTEQETQKARLKEAMLSELDKEFGAKFRNDAVQLANKKVGDSGVAPKGEFYIYKFIRDCYKELAEKVPKETPAKRGVSVDSGASGVMFKEGEIKEGSMEEVFPQIAAKYKGKGLSLPTT